MAQTSPNLKVNVTADTSQFTSGMKKAKSELKDFEKVSGNALSSIGSAFGVNTQKLEQMSSAIRGLGTKLTESGQAGAAAFGKILTSVGAASTAIAGIGIGAAVVSFKLLNEEAKAFKNSVQGANIELATTAYVETYKTMLHELNGNTGEAVAQTEAKWKRFFGSAFANIKSIGVAWTTNGADIGGAIATTTAKTYIATQAAEKARGIAEEIYAIQRKISDQQVYMAELDADISEQKRIAYATTNSTAVQAAALAKAIDLIRQKYEGSDGIIALETRLADLMKEQNDITWSSAADIDAANRQRVKANQLIRAENEEIKSLSRRQSSVNKALAAEAAARKETLDVTKKLVEVSSVGALTASPSPTLSNAATPALVLPQVEPWAWASFFDDVDKAIYKQYPDGLTIGVTFDAQEGLIDLTRELNSALTTIATTAGNAIGQLIGDLVTGGDAWSNFANVAMSAFGDMAISIGNIAIQSGLATIGIKAALESLNGYVAITAGVALVALGTAVKAGLSNIAGGNYTATSSYTASGNYSAASSSDYATKEVNIKVSGTLQASGSNLIAVIQNEENRKNHTT